MRQTCLSHFRLTFSVMNSSVILFMAVIEASEITQWPLFVWLLPAFLAKAPIKDLLHKDQSIQISMIYLFKT